MQQQAGLKKEIIAEVYRTLVLLGAESDLLGTIGSWGDSLSDDSVLSGLRTWNKTALSEIKGRIEHYEISFPLSADSQAEPQRTVAAK